MLADIVRRVVRQEFPVDIRRREQRPNERVQAPPAEQVWREIPRSSNRSFYEGIIISIIVGALVLLAALLSWPE